jgi:hypothetical protein
MRLLIALVPAPSSRHLAGPSSHRICFSNWILRVSGGAIGMGRVHVLTMFSAAGATTPPVQWEGVTTPPIPSSSPNFVPDSMDISPLPHKAPFSFLTERYQPLPSPSPEVTPSTDDDDNDMLSPCDLPTPPQFPTPMLEVSRPVSAAELV